MTKVVIKHGRVHATNEIPLANSFCTGRLSSCPAGEIDAYASPLESDGELAHRVRQRLDEGRGLREIALAMDLSWRQVLGVAMTDAPLSGVALQGFGGDTSDDFEPRNRVHMEAI